MPCSPHGVPGSVYMRMPRTCVMAHTCMYGRAHHDTAQHLHHAMRVGCDGDAGELMPSRLDVCWTNSVSIGEREEGAEAFKFDRPAKNLRLRRAQA